MAVYPNGSRLAYGFMPMYRLSAAQPGLTNVPGQDGLGARLGSRLGLFVATAGELDGYHLQALMPRVAGGMAGAASGSLDGLASLLQGAPLQGDAAVALYGEGSLFLTVSLAGDGSVALSTSAGLRLTLAMAGDGTVTLTGSLGLSLVVPFEGSAQASLSGSADLKGLLELETGVESNVLTAEQVAQAVWAALAASNDLPGSMGELLATAGSGGLTPTQVTMLTELWRMRGLDPAAPVTVTTTSETAGDVELAITGDGVTTSTLTRQP